MTDSPFVKRLKRVAGFIIRTTRMATYMVAFFVLILPTLSLLHVLFRVRLVLIDGNRFGPLMTDSDRIIRLVGEEEVKGKRHTRYVGLVGNFVNQSLKAILSRYMPYIVSPFLSQTISQVTRMYPSIGKLSFLVPRDIQNNCAIFSQNASKIKLSSEEKAKGQAALEEMGVGPDDWFVCFHARSGIYLNSMNAANNWSYHDFRDSSIENCLKMADKIVDQGGAAIRMGAAGEEPLKEPKSPKIIDYANTYKSELLDIYLAARCKFFVAGGGSGIGSASTFFDVPVAWHNLIPTLFLPWRKDDLFIPKLLWDQKKERILTLAEMHEIGIFGRDTKAYSSAFYEEKSLKPIENDENDILDLYLEMTDRVNGVHQDEEETALQHQFKKQFFNYEPDFEWGGDIGGRFLRKHSFLMD